MSECLDKTEMKIDWIDKWTLEVDDTNVHLRLDFSLQLLLKVYLSLQSVHGIIVDGI